MVFNFPDVGEEMAFATDDKSTEFSAFLRGPSSVSMSSDGLDWSGFTVARHSGEAREVPEAISKSHIIAHWHGRPSICEHLGPRGAYTLYRKLPGSTTLIPAGIVPAARSREPFDVVLCALRVDFVNRVKDELDSQPSICLEYRKKCEDQVVSQLMTLLTTEASEGGPSGRLYADHLAQALALRFLREEARSTWQTGSFYSPLPRHLLRRVFDRMNELNAGLDLLTLANETGYSRTHFLRMFQAATGTTPHRYLLQLRVSRAQELMRRASLSLIDIAAHCGFSSHAHMSKVFRQFLGVSPSTYRRSL
jgi:AraC family transcriptional regulator